MTKSKPRTVGTAAPKRSNLLGVAIFFGAVLAGCQAAVHDRYQLIGSEMTVDPSSGMRKKISHWRYADGTVTQSVKTEFDPSGSRRPRGTRGSHQ